MKDTKATAVLVHADYEGECPATLIRVEDPNKAFASLAPIFGPKPVVREPGIHATAVIGEGVTLGKNVYIGPYTVIEDGASIGDGTIIDGLVFIAQHVTIGRDCHLYPQVNIRESCVLGDRVILHAGVKIGTDGYGYTVEIGAKGPVITKVPQVGIVEIGNDVEIGSNTCIDRARFGRTRVGDCVKIDNLVQVGSPARSSGRRPESPATSPSTNARRSPPRPASRKTSPRASMSPVPRPSPSASSPKAFSSRVSSTSSKGRSQTWRPRSRPWKPSKCFAAPTPTSSKSTTRNESPSSGSLSRLPWRQHGCGR